MSSVRQEAEDFLNRQLAFRPGALLTEASHPKTATHSQTIRRWNWIWEKRRDRRNHQVVHATLLTNLHQKRPDVIRRHHAHNRQAG